MAQSPDNPLWEVRARQGKSVIVCDPESLTHFGLTLTAPYLIGLVLIDSQGRIHYEFNHTLTPPRLEPLWVKLAPQRYFASLARRVIQTSLLKEERDLIGGASLIYDSMQQEIYIPYCGLIPRAETPEHAQSFRKNAFPRLIETVAGLNQVLPLKQIFYLSKTLPEAKMKKFGFKAIPALPQRDYLKTSWWQRPFFSDFRAFFLPC